MSTTARRKVADLANLTRTVHQMPGFVEVASALQQGTSAAVDGAWGSSRALLAAALAEKCPQTLLVVLPQIHDVDDFADDFRSFRGQPPAVFPAWETLPDEHNAADATFGGRLRMLRELGGEQTPATLVTSLPALLQPVPSREARKKNARVLQVGEEVAPEDLLRWLVDRGFERMPAISLPGEMSLHGGIVDVFPTDALDPLRFEFFGDEIESIRRFDVDTQRKLDDLSEAEISVVSPVHEDQTADGSEQGGSFLGGESLFDSLPQGSWVVLVDLAELVQEGRQYLNRLSDPRGLFSVDAVLARCTQFPSVTLAGIAADSFETACHLNIESVERFAGPRTEAFAELANVAGRDEDVLIACHNEGERTRLEEILSDGHDALKDRVQLCVGTVSRGFRLVAERLIVLSDHELFGRPEVRRAPGRKKLETRTIDSFLDLKEGDLVVHVSHGIGRYLGMKRLEKDEQVEEHLVLEFRDGVRVFVPASLIHLVQKYVGAVKAIPKLSKLGGTSWARAKKRVSEAVTDLAGDMIRLQAMRAAREGIAFPPDSRWQQEFEAAFPYVETPDQVEAIAEVKLDMQRPEPMDRLICGDVGYGKTEVAMRAAFKAIDAGRQVAMLVPTTVLAEQHFRTFSERMAEYPIAVESLSRFKTKAEQRDILAGLAGGEVDMVIGTHRLVQKDVKFKDLGMLIIDEEQRFGVEAKEVLKALRTEIDVLTLSATPIPRTLHMAVLGIRDISNLTTAPQDRQSIETRISRFDPELIRHAMIRELNRSGQVYFVHNKVYNIQTIADRINQIVPEARIGIGHGQMRGDELEAVMYDFVAGRIDVLVCTTIIESGLDIPNANTIFIHQGDRYGLADLHQLRGRVGRYKHRAYCYLLLEEGRVVTPSAAKRLKAIEEFSELGAGFKIAMRDLEIRGAGNILGTEQSGHIATVGYELYCQLLETAVRRLKKEPVREYLHVAVDLPISAYMPDSYLPPGRQKIEMYRKLSQVRTLENVSDLESELRDRFGPLPAEVACLLELRELQIFAREWRIDDIHLEEKFAVFGYRDPQKIRHLAAARGSAFRVVDGKSAYYLLSGENRSGRGLLGELKSVLQPR